MPFRGFQLPNKMLHVAKVARQQLMMTARLRTAPSSKNLKILFITNAHNSLSQRAQVELEKRNHQVHVEIATSPQAMIQAKSSVQPDLIICPFLTAKVPETIWRDSSVPCLIVHPGVQGDRGMSSIDWALKRKQPEWGVTVLQAAEEMDAGDIWATRIFPIARSEDQLREPTKSSVYKVEVTNKAMECIDEAIDKFLHGVAPKTLDYQDPETVGQLNPTMPQEDRAIFDWSCIEGQDAALRIRFSDSQPGAKVKLLGSDFFAFGAEADSAAFSTANIAQPGEVVGKYNGSILVQAANDTRVWIQVLKVAGGIKLPAAQVLEDSMGSLLPELKRDLVHGRVESEHLFARPTGLLEDVWVHTTKTGVSFVHFEFYNGAASSAQCRRLQCALAALRQDESVKAVVLMGGQDAFSTGINLNVIEAAEDPVHESQSNIIAINDVIRELILMKDKTTVAVLQGSAAAGGVMLAAACDRVIAHAGVVLNPHYRLMGLYGSEYWTHFLPARVGEEKAQELTTTCRAISAEEALRCGLVDHLVGADVAELRGSLQREVDAMLSREHRTIRAEKEATRGTEWLQVVEAHRADELIKMWDNFKSPEYLLRRHAFVRKLKPTATPSHLLPVSASRLMRGHALRQRIEASVRSELRKASKSLPAFRPPTVLLLNGPAAPPDSLKYAEGVLKAGKEVGIEVRVEEVTEASLQLLRRRLCSDEVDGVVFNQPFPQGLGRTVASWLPADKDIDGVTAASLASLVRNKSGLDSGFVPATAEAVLELLVAEGVAVLGKDALVVGKGCVGLPIAQMLSNAGATVTQAHAGTLELKEQVRKADIVVSAAGVAGLVQGAWLKPGCAAVNVGMSWNAESQCFLPDIDFTQPHHAKHYTPSAWSVGSVTTALIMQHALRSYLSRAHRAASADTADKLSKRPSEACGMPPLQVDVTAPASDRLSLPQPRSPSTLSMPKCK